MIDCGSHLDIARTEAVRPGPKPFGQDLGPSNDAGDGFPDSGLGMICMKHWGAAAFGAQAVSALATIKASAMRRLPSQASATRRAAQ